MTLMMLIFWGGLAVLVVMLMCGVNARPGDRPAERSTDARALLDQHFARGEIDEADYRNRRDLLSSR